MCYADAFVNWVIDNIDFLIQWMVRIKVKKLTVRGRFIVPVTFFVFPSNNKYTQKKILLSNFSIVNCILWL